MEKLTLKNFSDLLDPDILDEGRAFLANDGLRNVVTADGVWAAEYQEKGQKGEIAIEITSGRIVSVQCECDDFDEEDWVDRACVHTAALLFAINSNSAQKAPATRSGRPKAGAEKDNKPAKAEKVPKKPAKPKDAAEAVLGELEPKEIYEFVRQMISKNMDFKSQFLMHFSEKTAGSSQQFDDIIAHAIAAVKGRRKYLKGADGAKIAVSITPLYKQAVNAEAKGFLRESFAICKALLHHLPKVFMAMETPSAKFNNLLENTLSIITLIIQNNTAPFELRNEVFETLMAEYTILAQGQYGELKDHVYELLLEAAQLHKRLDEVETVLLGLLAAHSAKGKKVPWSTDFYHETSLVDQLLSLYRKEAKNDAKATALLERYKHVATFYLMLIDKKTVAEDFKTAIAYLEDMRKNPRKYSNHMDMRGIEKVLDNRLLHIYGKMGDTINATLMAAKLFKSSDYQQFEYYKLEKSLYPAEKWPSRVDSYLQQTKQMQGRGYFNINAYFEIMLLEERWTTLMDKLAENSDLALWKKYGPHVKHRFPAAYLKGLRRTVEVELKRAYSPNYPLVTALLQDMDTVEGGSDLLKTVVTLYEDQYATRRALIELLNKIVIS